MITKSKSLGQLIKEADSVFSEYVRVRDAEPFTGIVKCFVTGEKAHWKKCDAAHMFGRGLMPIRWDELNVNATTVKSNRFDQDHQFQYITKFIAKHGSEAYENMYKLGCSLMKPTRSDIQAIIDKYSAKVKELRKQKHI